jgi:hypothetical protein
MGGSLTVRSDGEGLGAIFTMDLPFVKAGAASNGDTTALDAESPGAASKSSAPPIETSASPSESYTQTLD